MIDAHSHINYCTLDILEKTSNYKANQKVNRSMRMPCFLIVPPKFETKKKKISILLDYPPAETTGGDKEKYYKEWHAYFNIYTLIQQRF